MRKNTVQRKDVETAMYLIFDHDFISVYICRKFRLRINMYWACDLF